MSCLLDMRFGGGARAGWRLASVTARCVCHCGSGSCASWATAERDEATLWLAHLLVGCMSRHMVHACTSDAVAWAYYSGVPAYGLPRLHLSALNGVQERFVAVTDADFYRHRSLLDAVSSPLLARCDTSCVQIPKHLTLNLTLTWDLA